MERKIGEIFTCDGKTYQVVRGITCDGCCILYDHCFSIRESLGPCADANRTDKTGIIFKEINNMETKIDIVTILKDKPENTKLYSPLFGYVYFLGVEDDIIKVTYQGKLVIFFGDGRYYNYPKSEPLLFPSKKMRDWSKFAWKKGDILTNSSDFKVFLIDGRMMITQGSLARLIF